VKAALSQINTAWEDRRKNYEKAYTFAKKAADDKCDLIVFPEMFNTGFSMNLSAIADEDIGETTSLLSGIAKNNNINLIAGFPIKSPAEDKGRNMAVVYDRKGMLVATYTKMHPFCLAGEEKHYVAGDSVTVVDIDGMPSSVFICYDLRFPEIFRRVAKKVKAIFVIANWPALRDDHWEALLKARAIENQCFMIGVNRTGTDANGISYSGSSCIFGPMGELACSANETDEYIVCDFDPAKVDEVRTQYPFLRDMRFPDDKEE
jgi:omega-amidase